MLYPNLTWRKKTSEKVIYLTFDDGPVPEATDFVLNQLKVVEAKATFFCVVENIEKYNQQFKRILEEGHKIGNHTFNHLNGWKQEDEVYLANCTQANTSILTHMDESQRYLYRSTFTGKKLFRPPYGKIKKSQIKALKEEYEIIMWDVLTGDFDKKLHPEKCLEKAIRYTKPGSIVIFHDSVKALPNLSYALPRYLDYFTKLGYRFETL